MIERLRRLDIQVTAHDGRLRVNAPPGTLTSELRADLARHRAEIVAMLEQASSEADAPRPYAGVNAGGGHPVSLDQEGMLFLHNLNPESAAYNVAFAYRVRGALDRGALERALSRIIARHANLRSRFVLEGGAWCQLVDPPADVALEVVDVSSPAEDVEAALIREMRRPFVLERGGLFRVLSFSEGSERQTLLFATHHLVFDGWSIARFARELSAEYAAACAGADSAIAALEVQYSDFARWQRSAEHRPALDRALEHWRKLLAAPPELRLAPDLEAAEQRSKEAARVELEISSALRERLEAIAREQQTTPFVLFLTAFEVLLARYTQQDDVVVGCPFANRVPATERLIGHFVNVLPLRTDLTGARTFREALERVRATVAAALAREGVPVDELARSVRRDRGAGRQPLFRTSFMMQDERDLELELRGLEVERLSLPPPGAIFEVTLSIDTRASGAKASLYYDTGLFLAARAEVILGHYLRLLDDVARDPEARLAHLPSVSAAERVRLVEELSGARARLPELAGAIDPFLRWASSHPKRVAIDADSGAITYGSLAYEVDRLAHRLLARGVGPEQRVAVLLPRSAELIASALAVLRAGGTYVPLDPAHPPQRIAELLSDLDPRAVVTDPRGAALVPAGAPAVLKIGEEDAHVEGAIRTAPSAAVAAYGIYTSGSTGRPKAVIVSIGALANLIRWHARAHPLQPGDRTMLVAAPGFDASVWEIFSAVNAGATICVPSDETRADPAALAEWISRQKISVAFLPTPAAELFLDQPAARETSLRALLTGGDVLVKKPRAGAMPFALSNHYGPTEAAVVSTWTPGDVAESRRVVPPIGRPIDGVEVYLADGELELVPLGVPGELLIGGLALARGYAGAPDLTAEKFVPHPFTDQPGARLYRSGDLARWTADGELEFLGRVDRQVQIRGMRVDPAEIEAALGAHPAVRASAVIVRSNERRLSAYYSAESPLPAGELRAHAAERLPAHMVPVDFVWLEALPLTANGKVDVAALPEPSLGVSRSDAEAPRSELEMRMAELWREVLGVPAVGRYDSFFQLGGHSLLLLRLQARIRAELGRDVPIAQLFQHSTLDQLCRVLGEAPEEDDLADRARRRAELQRRAREGRGRRP